MAADPAERVLSGAHSLSPHLGERMCATNLLGNSVFVRELLPQDLKLEIEALTREEALSVAEFLAYTVGLAHARQLNSTDREGWLADLQRGQNVGRSFLAVGQCCRSGRRTRVSLPATL
jgi:uncharacterized protein (DUF2252 family)